MTRNRFPSSHLPTRCAMAISGKQYPAITIAALILSLAWAVYHFAVFNFFNGMVYDFLTRQSAKAAPSQSLIVLEGARDLAGVGDELWLPLLKNLLAQDVKLLAFNVLPERASAAFYQLAADSGKVVFGRQLLTDALDSEARRQPLPAAAVGKNLKLGMLTAAPSQAGIYRRQTRQIDADGGLAPTFETVAAQRALGQPANPAGEYRINFIGDTARIPKINLAHAIAGRLVPELVKGKVVLVGLYGMDAIARYYTPLSAASGLTPDVMYHAFALDSLLSDSSIRPLPASVMLPAIAAITLLALIYCQYLSLPRSFFLSAALSFACLAFSGLLLHALFLWMPIAGVLTAIWLTFVLIGWYKIARDNQGAAALMFKLSADMQDKVFPVSFYHSEEPWNQLVSLINQSLNLNRMIFLERMPGDHRLKEIKAFKCSIDDVLERRRDYKRLPYSQAIQENRPLCQENPYLTPLETSERQYLAPLIFAGEVLGFWAFAVEPGVQSTDKFLALVQAYMSEISEILYHRQKWRQRAARENNPWRAFLSFDAGGKNYRMLRQSVALLEKRLTQLQQVFNSMNSRGILYDLFGQVLLINTPMEILAKTCELKLYDMTALDFIIAMTGYDADAARLIMQKAIFDHETLSLPVTHPITLRDYILHVQPLKISPRLSGYDDSSALFQVSGIFCELSDVTEFKAIYRLKEQTLERFCFQIRNDLTAIIFALSILEDESAPAENKAFALSNIQGKAATVLATMQLMTAQKHNEAEQIAARFGSYPVNGLDALQKAVDALRDYAAQRAVKLRLSSPALLSLVYASPTELDEAFNGILTSMIDDSFEGSELTIDIEEQSTQVCFHFRNHGIGIAYQEQNTAPGTNETSQFDTLSRYVERWSGHIDLFSQVGVGSTVTITLNRFL